MEDVEMSYSAGAVVWKYIDGALFVLIQGKSKLYDWGYGKILLGFPGGSNNPNERNPLVTLARELKEEIGLEPKDPQGFRPEMIYSVAKQEDGHRNYFYLVPYSDLSGKLRTENIMDGEHVLLPPFWISFSQLEFGMNQASGPGPVMNTHLGALREAIERLKTFKRVA